jgi:hypothetical protein
MNLNRHLCSVVAACIVPFLFAAVAIAAQPVPPSNPEAAPVPRLPVYVAELSNLNDYTLFANGGWDGNWYVGFNVCWIEELSAPSTGTYRRAYIGAKLGRAKTQVAPGKPVWEKENIPGEIYLSLASTPSWKATQKYFLTDAADIPAQGDPENALENVGESRWFWTEVPVAAVNFTGPNYVALWSPTEYFVSASSSPLLAGGWGGQEVNSWLNNDVRGYAPLNAATALKTPLSVFEPAIALKLIPAGEPQQIGVTIEAIVDGRAKTANKTFIAHIAGQEIEKAWLEVSLNDGPWRKYGRFIYTAPYMFTLKADALPNGKIAVRCVAADVWGDIGSSRPVELQVAR